MDTRDFPRKTDSTRRNRQNVYRETDTHGTLASVRLIQVSPYNFMFFGTVGLYRSDMLCLFSAWFCPCVQMFRWFCPSTFFFARHQHDTLSSLPHDNLDPRVSLLPAPSLSLSLSRYRGREEERPWERGWPPETRDVAARDSGDRRVQGTEPDIVNGSILQLKCASICLLALF